MCEEILSVKDLKTYFNSRTSTFLGKSPSIRAVDGINLSINAGESFGLVGESGCGKSTTGRSILRLIQPTSGSINFAGRDVMTADKKSLRTLRREMQMIFQDPYSSLNPRMRVLDIVAEPLIVHRLAKPSEAATKAKKVLDHCGIPDGSVQRFPREFSGGQRQRIVIARALVTRPRFIVADEPVSALDVSIQAQILNLLQDLRDEYSLTYLFISHDLAIVRTVTNRIAVMYLGKIVEQADTSVFFSGPLHPYSRALLSSVPRETPDEDKKRIILTGNIPSAANPPKGCNFHTRCPLFTEKCKKIAPELIPVSKGHSVACHLALKSSK
ncbi:MAG: ABC transporter ATP-binding protein [Spirochaetales bacterium]|nr:ABC transporter ATP-binding protein [Spirochaetales bacterium]